MSTNTEENNPLPENTAVYTEEVKTTNFVVWVLSTLLFVSVAIILYIDSYHPAVKALKDKTIELNKAQTNINTVNNQYKQLVNFTTKFLTSSNMEEIVYYPNGDINLSYNATNSYKNSYTWKIETNNLIITKYPWLAPEEKKTTSSVIKKNPFSRR